MIRERYSMKSQWVRGWRISMTNIATLTGRAITARCLQEPDSEDESKMRPTEYELTKACFRAIPRGWRYSDARGFKRAKDRCEMAIQRIVRYP